MDTVVMVSSNLITPNEVDAGGILYQETSYGVYTAHVTLPVNLPAGDFFLQYFMINYTDSAGLGTGYAVRWAEPGHDVNGIFVDSSGRYTQKITVKPLFTGTENVSVLKGSSFDPMAGVSASNNTDGDITSMIEMEAPANFNTANVGIYLFKYKIKSNHTDYNGNTLYYYDFRWVGVTEALPGDTGSGAPPLVVTDDSIVVGASATDVTLTKDGNDMAVTGKVSGAGSYVLTVKGSGSAGKSKAAFTVDRSAPALTATQTGIWPDKAVKVQVQAKDQSGVAVLKWCKGALTLDAMRRSGTAFKGSFLAKEFCKYTVYAKDVFGRESLAVVDVKYIKLNSVKMSKSSLSIPVGGTYKLSAVLSPANATYRQLAWTSKNPKVATVDSAGKIKAISPGTTVIYARATNGMTAKCTVKVKPVTVSKVSMNKTSLSMTVKSTYKLSATVAPANATYKTLKWYSANAKIATVDKYGKVTAKKKGSVYIYAKASNGKYARCHVTVK